MIIESTINELYIDLPVLIVSDWNVGSVSNTAIFDPPIARMSKWTIRVERPAEYTGSSFSDVLDFDRTLVWGAQNLLLSNSLLKYIRCILTN